MAHWAYDAVFYHIYPLGLCGAPARNDLVSPPVERLAELHGWLDHLRELGANALYLGPLFESTAHGYDTADYYRVDRRLGTNETLKRLVAACHEQGIRVILDGVFHHVGRDFWAFRDVCTQGERSAYCAWFRGLRFDGRSPRGDPFTYETWNGHHDLVRLDLENGAVREHLFGAVQMWVDEFAIDGLRLDTADCLDPDYRRALAAHCRRLRPDFWLMGEVVHGDYRQWANPEMLDSVTNYEAYKGLYSSHVDRNYFEIAYALNRQFGEGGLYRSLPLYAFADNHDVNRVASSLNDPAHLYPLYCLLFTMPGVPSIYYGSEWGLQGKRSQWSDRALRPALDLTQAALSTPQPGLAKAIGALASVRRATPALRYGGYRQLHVSHEQLAFARETAEQCVVVAVNAAHEPIALDLELAGIQARELVDLLNGGERFPVRGGKARIEPLNSCWARVLLACGQG